MAKGRGVVKKISNIRKRKFLTRRGITKEKKIFHVIIDNDDTKKEEKYVQCTAFLCRICLFEYCNY